MVVCNLDQLKLGQFWVHDVWCVVAVVVDVEGVQLSSSYHGGIHHHLHYYHNHHCLLVAAVVVGLHLVEGIWPGFVP